MGKSCEANHKRQTVDFKVISFTQNLAVSEHVFVKEVYLSNLEILTKL